MELYQRIELSPKEAIKHCIAKVDERLEITVLDTIDRARLREAYLHCITLKFTRPDDYDASFETKCAQQEKRIMRRYGLQRAARENEKEIDAFWEQLGKREAAPE